MLTIDAVRELPEDSLNGDDALCDAVAEFSYFLCTEDFVDGLPDSTGLVYFSGVLGFSPDGSTFERPRNCLQKCAMG